MGDMGVSAPFVEIPHGDPWLDPDDPIVPRGPSAAGLPLFPFADAPSTGQDLLAAMRYGVLFSNPVVDRFVPPSELVIRRSVIIISNPRAGSGKANWVKGQLLAELEWMESDGKLVIQGDDSVYLRTKADPRVRVAAILDAIRKGDPARPPIIVVLGGDGTFADVIEAVLKASEEGYRPILVPGPGGTAGDMRIELGVPRDPRLMPKFLATAQDAELSVITVRVDDGPERVVVHSQGNGVSGAVFGEVEKVRSAGGKVSVGTYVRALVKGIGETEAFYVKINGGEPVVAGEVLTLANSTSMGSIVRVPLPKTGGTLHVIPVTPDLPGAMRLVPGLMPVADVARRGLLYLLGKQTVVAPGNRINFLDPKRTMPIAPGDKILLEFVDAAGDPKPVAGIINGDPFPPATRVLLEGKRATIATLAAADSGLMVRRGLAQPRTMAQSFLDGICQSTDRFGTGTALGLIGIFELWRDAAHLSPGMQRAADLSTAVGLVSADAFAVWRYGTISYFAELPLIAGPFGAGYELAATGTDYAARETGVAFLDRDHAGGRIAGIAGGSALTWGAMKLVGVEAWKASAANINAFLVRTIGGAGEVVETFLGAASRFVPRLFLTFPIVVLPEIFDAAPLDPLDPRNVPTA